MDRKKNHSEDKAENIYRLDGRVPIAKAIPFGIQHILAIFVAMVFIIAVILNLVLPKNMEVEKITAKKEEAAEEK